MDKSNLLLNAFIDKYNFEHDRYKLDDEEVTTEILQQKFQSGNRMFLNTRCSHVCIPLRKA